MGKGAATTAGMPNANSARNSDNSALGAQGDGFTLDMQGADSTLSHTCRLCSGLSPALAHGQDSDPIADALYHEDSTELLKLLVFLGGNLSRKFLERLRESKVTWGNRGDIQLQHPRNIPVVADESRLTRAIQTLEKHFVLSKEGASVLSVLPSVRQEVESAARDSVEWKFRALSAVLHVFPEHRHLQPVYYFNVANASLPQLRYVLPYLRDPAVYSKLESFQVTQAANVCMSSSYFLGSDWKQDVLNAAEILLGLDDQTRARFKLRSMELSRISGKSTSDKQLPEIDELRLSFRPHDERSNAYLGEMVLFQARLLIDIGEYQQALLVLDTFRPLDPVRVSKIEQSTLNDIAFVRGEVARYRGKFAEAEASFLRLLDYTPPPAKVATQLSAVCCELGRFDFSIRSLNNDLELLEKNGHAMESRNANRLQLALAEAYLMKAVKLAASQKEDIAAHKVSITVLELAGKARGLLECLWPSFDDVRRLGKVGKINRFKVLAAFAITENLA
ncbi:hypothetical protein VTK56DRAFT_7009 [Thermocarpiscus australiensis]